MASRIHTATVCQPDATSAPKCERAAAASSMWNGCGSNRAAHDLISSAGNVWVPNDARSPTAMSSKYFIALMPRTRCHRRGGREAAPRDQHRAHQGHHAVARLVEHLVAELDEAHAGPAAGRPHLH